jgi:hypothetical protein
MHIKRVMILFIFLLAPFGSCVRCFYESCVALDLTEHFYQLSSITLNIWLEFKVCAICIVESSKSASLFIFPHYLCFGLQIK